MVWLKRDSAHRSLRPAKSEEESQPAPTFQQPVEVSAGTKGEDIRPRVSRHPEALEQIRKLIEEGHFPQGSKLPPERALAIQLGLGRPSLREAIKALNILGVLESRRGAGTYVKSSEPLASQWSVDRSLESPKFGVLDLLEFRKILEPRAAWLAATRATERQLLEIEAARQNLEMHDQDWRLVAKLDNELHATIVRSAQNPVFDLISQCLKSHSLGHQSWIARFAPDVARMRRDHKAIVESILKRQADAAEKAMIDHLHALGLDFLSEASSR